MEKFQGILFTLKKENNIRTSRIKAFMILQHLVITMAC